MFSLDEICMEKSFPIDFNDYMHEEDEINEDFDEETEESSFSCDTCERDFYTEDQYNVHMSEHRTCNLEGCTFTAHEKIIEKHIKMQHLTGLYEKIKKLDNPEEIAAWIEERKRKYPSKENVEKRSQQQEALLKKGVRLRKNSNKFGKDKFRLESTAKHQQSKFLKNTLKTKKKKRRQQPKVSLIDEKADWNGKMFPFKGTSDLFENLATKQTSDYEDDEWREHSSVAAPVKINKSLGSLMTAYGSDSEEEEPAKIGPTSDNEAPEEVKIVKVASEVGSEESAKIINRKRKRPMKKQIVKKKQKYDDAVPSTSTGITRSHPNYFPHNNFRKRKVTLLEKLLEGEIRQERNLLLQCVRFVVENNFFKEK